MLRLPRSYTNLSGSHVLHADARMTQEVSQMSGPAVDVEKSPDAVANLDYETWLPFAAKTYHISPHIEDYVVFPTPICPAGLPNRNGIGFPLEELTRYQPPPISRMVYKAWAGTPVHFEHDNEDCTKAFGVVLDARLTKMVGYGGGRHWKVMGLAAVDKNKHPDIAQEVIDRKIDTVSMGATADYFRCSVCGAQVFGPKEKYRNCHHVTHSQDVNFKIVRVDNQNLLAFLWAYSLSPIELSLVRDPAWVVANSETVF